MLRTSLQTNPATHRDELCEEEFYLFPEWDIHPYNTVMLRISPIQQCGYRVMSPLKISITEFFNKSVDN
jgi:hypothetical protein